jgi:hypothetical protein
VALAPLFRDGRSEDVAPARHADLSRRSQRKAGRSWEFISMRFYQDVAPMALEQKSGFI